MAPVLSLLYTLTGDEHGVAEIETMPQQARAAGLVLRELPG